MTILRLMSVSLGIFVQASGMALLMEAMAKETSMNPAPKGTVFWCLLIPCCRTMADDAGMYLMSPPLEQICSARQAAGMLMERSHSHWPPEPAQWRQPALHCITC